MDIEKGVGEIDFVEGEGQQACFFISGRVNQVNQRFVFQYC